LPLCSAEGGSFAKPHASHHSVSGTELNPTSV